MWNKSKKHAKQHVKEKTADVKSLKSMAADLPDDAMLEELLTAEFAKDVDGKWPAAGCIRAYAADITPFKDLIGRVVAGLVMGSITVSFWGLGWILPLAGSILIYSGLRGLRRVNRWMRTAWILSMLMLLYHGTLIFVCASPLYPVVGNWRNWPGAGLTLVMLYCLGKGMQSVNCGTAGDVKRAGNPTLPIILWKIAAIALALLESRIGQDYMTVLAIAMFVFFIFTIRSILKIADVIQDGGYTMEAAPVRISEKRLWVGLTVFFIAGLIVCNIVFHYTPVDWQESGLANDAQQIEAGTSGSTSVQQEMEVHDATEGMQTLRRDLEAKGFRANLLTQIADEDLADLKDREILNVRVADYDEAQNGECSKKMQGSMVYVLTEEAEAKAFFLYAYLDEGILKPHSWIADGASLLANREWGAGYGGRIFCEKGGKTLEAVPDVEKETIVTPWIGESTMTRSYIKARYSYPLFSRNQRGYLYTWLDDELYVYGTISDIYSCAPGVQLPYRELPPIDRSGTLSFGSAPKERILSLYTSYDVLGEFSSYVDDVGDHLRSLGKGMDED